MSGPLLLIGIFCAFAVFGAMLSSISRLLSDELMGRRLLQGAHALAILSLLLVMGALWSVSEGGDFFGLPPVAVTKIGGGALAAAAAAAIMLERGWTRWSPAPLALFGAVAASGAPFS